tara:strand:- start:2378 stop:3013 length:636 start_codon:yes stop_codon:yes gene_type:complete
MSKKAKLFLVSPNDLIRNLSEIKDTKLRRSITNFIIQFDMSSFNKDNNSAWDNYKFDPDGYSTPGIYSTKNMPTYSYSSDDITERKFDDLLDEFITNLLNMSTVEKSEFLKSLENISKPLDSSETNPDNIYNIINTIYYNYSDNDIFNSVKVSKLEKTGTIVLSSYNLTSIEKLKAKLVKEGIKDIRYRIVKNPYNQKKIHTIMYDRIGEK